jgi:hypothetical protein
MRTSAIALILFLTLSSAPLPAAPLPLRVVGNKVYDSNDCLIRLKGVNIPSMEWRDTGEGPPGSGVYPVTVTVNEALTNWGANLIRLPLSQDFWFGYPNSKDSSVNQGVYRGIVDSIVDMCSARGAYVLLDLHWSGTGTWGSATDIWVMPDSNAVTFWTDVATRYADHPAVLFDLFNEPHDISWSTWRDGGGVFSNGTPYLTPGMQALLDAVRATGAGNVVVAGCLDWAYDLRGIVPGYAGRPDGWALTESGGNGVIYATHIYPWKGTPWDNYVTVLKNHRPILVGEVGQERDGLRQFTGGIAAILDWMDLHGYHWTGWSMHPGASPCMIADWLFSPTTYEGSAMKTRLVATSSGQGCATPTPTATATATHTPCYVATGVPCSPTPTSTSTPDNGAEGIVLYPNPVQEGETVRFWVNFPKPAAELVVRFYTPSSRIVAVKRLTKVASGEHTLSLRDDRGRLLSNGVYYLKFSTNTRERVCKLLVLR